MCGDVLKREYIRNNLSEVILGELDSWPDLHRQAFVQAHYQGQSLEQVSRSLGMRVPDVRQILTQCERRLREAVRAFREPTKEAQLASSLRPPAIAASGYLY